MAEIRAAKEGQHMVHIAGQQDASPQMKMMLQGEKGSRVITATSTGEQNGESSGVILEISEDGKAKQSNRQKLQDDAQWIQRWAQEMYKQRAEAADKNSKAFDDIAKAMEIARRIARGDIVPLKDEKKLIEFSADLYQVAKASAAINADKKHKKYDSLYDDEDDSIRDKMRTLKQENEMSSAEAVSATMTAPPKTGATVGMEQ